MRKKLAGLILAILILVTLFQLIQSRPVDLDPFKKVYKKYNVEILRDTWGVPHIFGDTDADVAFGFAYAHAEDDFQTIQNAILASRGQLAAVYGRKAAPKDNMVHLLRIWQVVNAKYASELSPEVRAVCEAYADGLNYYAALHPDEAMAPLFPVTGRDLVAGFLHKIPFFFGLDRVLLKLFNSEYKNQSKAAKTAGIMHEPFRPARLWGSNAFAVAPARSADSKTRLAINSHQPWEGPVAWYEAHLHSNAGWDIVGGVFPGAPIILHGHNRFLGWAHTVNMPDLVDVYALNINPNNPNQYRFDGQWKELEVAQAPIKVKLFGPFSWTVKKQVLWSIYGPVVRTKSGTYALRYAGYGRIGQVEQWFRMNKARNFNQWLAAMKMQQLPMFNTVYADAQGNIYYLYNALLPLRSERFDWSEAVPGTTSATLWQSYLPFEQLPQVLNPASHFVQNCNSTPFQTTTGPDNPNPRDYPAAFGIETRLTNRAMRALQLFGGDAAISAREFYRYKFDVTYSPKSKMARLVRQAAHLQVTGDGLLESAIGHLQTWDLRANAGNTGAALAELAFKPFLKPNAPEKLPADSVLAQRIHEAAQELLDVYGRLDVPWQKVNRLIRGRLDLGLGGAPDVLRAVHTKKIGKARLQGTAGDSYILLVEWDRQGKVRSRSIHQYGSATLDASSPHYADQAPLFVKQQLKPVWLDEADIRAHLERAYRPGEEK